MFRNAEESHAHSLNTLNVLYEYDDFMESVSTVLDLGCGDGLDMKWWATRTTRDEVAQPLNIRCIGIDLRESIPITNSGLNIGYQQGDFENNILVTKRTQFDILWSHDSFQYSVDPIRTLSYWWSIAAENAMLVLVVPETMSIERRQLAFYQPAGCYYHHTMVSLMHMLAVSGWDCRSGFFKKEPNDPWLHAIVYKGSQEPLDPKKTTWYDLADRQLLPDSAVQSIQRYGHLKQQDLVLPWLDKSLSWLGKQ